MLTAPQFVFMVLIVSLFTVLTGRHTVDWTTDEALANLQPVAFILQLLICVLFAHFFTDFLKSKYSKKINFIIITNSFADLGKNLVKSLKKDLGIIALITSIIILTVFFIVTTQTVNSLNWSFIISITFCISLHLFGIFLFVTFFLGKRGVEGNLDGMNPTFMVLTLITIIFTISIVFVTQQGEYLKETFLKIGERRESPESDSAVLIILFIIIYLLLVFAYSKRDPKHQEKAEGVNFVFMILTLLAMFATTTFFIFSATHILISKT